MKSSDLTAEQRKKLEERITGELKYLTALVDRMTVQKFPEDDPLRVKTQAAHEAVMALLVQIQKTGMPTGAYPDFSYGQSNPEYDEISKRIAPAVEAANKHRRWRR